MRIVADQNIPFVGQVFAGMGDVHFVNGRQIDAADLKSADVLLVRSVTSVSSELLEGAGVQFVGSVTTGVDHIDRAYLQTRQIGFAHAPGSNADSVVEYVLSVLMHISAESKFRLADKTVGILGYGNIGSRLVRVLRLLGIECLVYDPPLEGQIEPPGFKFASFEDVQRADIISLHTPLVRNGPYPTYHMVDHAFLKALKPSAILINTARGQVVDNDALLDHLKNVSMSAVLDVWENEPAINLDLLKLTQLATPHIAGYSVDGKLSAVHAVYIEFCKHFGLTPHWELELPLSDSPEASISADLPSMEAVRAMVLHAYNVKKDDEKLRALTKEIPFSHSFDAMRGNYPPRRKFSAFKCNYTGSKLTRQLLEGVGFTVVSPKA